MIHSWSLQALQQFINNICDIIAIKINTKYENNWIHTTHVLLIIGNSKNVKAVVK